MKKTVVAVAMGGHSSEFDISIKSGQTVCQNLDADRFEVYPLVIKKDGWTAKDQDGNDIVVSKGTLALHTNNGPVVPDVVFNTIHGTPGEDGILAAFLELLGIPQTSAGFYAAALTFNKRDTLSVLKKYNVTTARSVYLNQGDAIDPEAIITSVGLPCFVKPNRSGSSYGISKVHNIEDLIPAIESAKAEDHQIIIEQAIIGTEVSVGAYRNKEGIQILPSTEIVAHNDFFDYKAKYEGESEEITPARIDPQQEQLVGKAMEQIYHLLELNGVARAEFILQDGIPYFLEINTTPGLSSESIVPKQLQAAGISLQAFFTQLIEQALLKL